MASRSMRQLSSKTRTFAVVLLASMAIIGSSPSVSVAQSSEDEGRDLDLGAYCNARDMDVIFVPGARPDAKSWRCAETTYTTRTDSEESDGLEIGSEGSVGVDTHVSTNSTASETRTNSNGTEVNHRTYPINMTKACEAQYGKDWHAETDDWSDPYSWQCYPDD